MRLRGCCWSGVSGCTKILPIGVLVRTYAGRRQAMIHAHRCDCLRTPYPTRRVKKMLMAPEGMFINAACLGA